MFGCISCEWQFSMDEDVEVVVDRYDRIQSLYLTTGDFSALQQMNTVYPMQTRTLIEDVLRIGKVDDQLISKKFLRFYQDSTLQILIAEAEQQYANMDDINADLTAAFKYLGTDYPLYQKPQYGYTKSQLELMNRQYIVPDCIGFYLLSMYPMPQNRALSQQERDTHIGKILWVVNKALGKNMFNSLYTRMVERYMKRNKNLSLDQMLKNNNYSDFRKN